MPDMFEPIRIGGVTVKNRIVLPPMVCFGWAGENGRVTARNVRHYEARARGGAGLIILEAHAVNRDGRLAESQLGIWADEHIEGLRRIADRCHEHGSAVLAQIHHAGLQTPPGVSEIPVAPSTYTDDKGRTARELARDEIEGLQKDFLDAASRAHAAGLDGIELHGAHGYLMSQFASPRVNLRTDEYGGAISGRMRFATELVKKIRLRLPPGFVIGYRMGSNEPTLKDSQEMARILEDAGVDVLHVSTGMSGSPPLQVPEGFPGNWIVYGGTEIHENSAVPVIVVNGIRTPAQARLFLDSGMTDFVAVGRGQLADPNWALAALEGREPVPCRGCKPCRWFADGTACPNYQ